MRVVGGSCGCECVNDGVAVMFVSWSVQKHEYLPWNGWIVIFEGSWM